MGEFPHRVALPLSLNIAPSVGVDFEMASALWTGKIPMFLTLCLAFRNHISSWAALVVRVMSRTPIEDEKPVLQNSSPI